MNNYNLTLIPLLFSILCIIAFAFMTLSGLNLGADSTELGNQKNLSIPGGPGEITAALPCSDPQPDCPQKPSEPEASTIMLPNDNYMGVPVQVPAADNTMAT